MKIFYTFIAAMALCLTLASGSSSSCPLPTYVAALNPNSIKKFTVNEFTVYSIRDCDSSLKADLFSGPLSEEQRLALLPGGQAKGSVNVYLIKGPAGHILVDAGWGRSGPGQGMLARWLKEIGLSPEDVDLVILTHMHPDHIGGLLDGPDPAFPKAKIMASRAELAFWRGLTEKKSPDEAAAAPEAEAPEPAAETDAPKALAPGASADQADEQPEPAPKPPVAPGDLPQALISAYGPRLTSFDFDQEISPSLTALNAVGHTPGHTAFLLKSGEHQLLFIGDLLHAAALQFPEPDEYVSYDMDQVQAVAARKAVLKMAADRELPVAGAHIPFPGIGQVEADGKRGFTFSPVDGTKVFAGDLNSGQWEFTMGSMF